MSSFVDVRLFDTCAIITGGAGGSDKGSYKLTFIIHIYTVNTVHISHEYICVLLAMNY